MEYTYYITRRDRWNHVDGPEIYPAEWAACIDGDSELSLDETGNVERGAVHWQSRDEAFRFDGGNIVGETADRETLCKMIDLAKVLDARVMDEDGVVYVQAPRPTTGMRHKKRVIPRAAAALLLSIVGLVLLGGAILNLFVNHEYEEVSLRGAAYSFITPPLAGIGAVAIITSILFAVTSLYPWDRRWSKFAVTALILDLLPLLLVA